MNGQSTVKYRRQTKRTEHTDHDNSKVIWFNVYNCPCCIPLFVVIIKNLMNHLVGKKINK